jgi:hypothetical protein
LRGSEAVVKLAAPTLLFSRRGGRFCHDPPCTGFQRLRVDVSTRA